MIFIGQRETNRLNKIAVARVTDCGSSKLYLSVSVCMSALVSPHYRSCYVHAYDAKRGVDTTLGMRTCLRCCALRRQTRYTLFAIKKKKQKTP